jgi:uncharacterized protein YjiS (DUF1127 family)
MVTIIYIVIFQPSMHKQFADTISRKAAKMGTIDTIDGAAGTVQPSRSYPPALITGLQRIVGKLRIAMRNRRTRVHLADLTDDQLRDIGITRQEARKEVGKSVFWSSDFPNC